MDQTTLLIIGGAIAVLILLFLLLRGRGRQRVELGSAPAAPTLARRVDPAEGRGVADEAAAATADVAGEILGVEAHPLAAPEAGPADDLRMLKGVGPKLLAQLNANGITRFEQLAGLGETEVAMLDERMGPFRGRIAKDRLAEQAAYLARGDKDGFEAQFGKLGGAA
jgi:predicted flap endonuclease-1-like 5' DNA nuclease